MADLDGIESERILKSEEVAEMLALTPMMVHKLALTGQLASFKFGAARRFRIEDVREYMTRSYRPAAPIDEAAEEEEVAA